ARGRAAARDRSPRRQAVPRPLVASEARPLSRPSAQARAPGTAVERRRAAAPHLTPPPNRWRLVFMGTPPFACTILEALLTRPDPAWAVCSQPVRPRARGPPGRAVRLTVRPARARTRAHAAGGQAARGGHRLARAATRARARPGVH